MRALVLACTILLAANGARAQRHRLTSINTETPEGALLQLIGQEQDEAKKLALMEEFASKYPKHEAAAWVYSQMQPAYMKASQFDKAMDVGEKLLALDPEDVEFAHQTLKAAEGKKDPDLVKKWAVQVSEVARKVAQTPKPKEEDEAESWKQRVDFAKQVDVYTEYSLFATALQAASPDKKAELMATLEQRNPQNQYLPQLRQQVFMTYFQAKSLDQAVAVAEQTAQKGQPSQEMMLVAADYYLFKKDPDKALVWCAKIVDTMGALPKPEGASDADWQKAKDNALGRARWMAGVIYAGQNKNVQADKELRAALPLIKDNEQLLAEALFHLGVANFRLGDVAKPDQQRLLDAYNFTRQCAAIRSPYQGRAQTNMKAMQNKYKFK